MTRLINTNERIALLKAIEDRLANLNLRRNPCMNCENMMCSLIGVDQCCSNFANWVTERNTIRILYNQIDDSKYEWSIKENTKEET